MASSAEGPRGPARAGEPPPSSEAVRRELGDVRRSHEQRRRQLPRALLVGFLAGLVAVAFRRGLEYGDALRVRLSALSDVHPLLALLAFVGCGAFGAGFAVLLVQRLEPDAAGSGIQHVEAVLHHLRALRWRRILPVKFLGGLSGIGLGGLALGREGPTIQMGSAVGQMVSGWFRCTRRERQTLIAAGAGAGLSAAFNAPLAGLVFVLEELQRDFAPAVFTVTLIACVVSDVTARSLTSDLPVFHVAAHPIPPLATLPVCLLLGVSAALLGVAFNRCLVGSLQLFSRLGSVPPWLRGAAVGAAVGLVGWLVPNALAGGHGLVEATLAGALSLPLLLGFFLLRFGLTMSSYGSGAPGGIFAPMLVLGATLGMGFGQIATRWFPDVFGHPQTFAVVGMAALFAGVVRAPLTAIVLMVEMTGDYALILPLLVAVLTAAGLADYLGDRPIYEVLLRRDLRRWRDVPQLEQTLLLDLTVAPGAAFEGLAVRELGLPPGCLVVSVRRGLAEHVATATLRLEGGDRLTVIVSPEAASAVALLHEGVAPTRGGGVAGSTPVPTA